MKKVDPRNSITLQGWMVAGLDLRGPELLTYAIVYQFSQSKAGIYKGGVPYIMAWLGCSDDSARKYLHSLESKGLIKATDGRNKGVPYRHYETLDNQIPENLGYIPENFGGDTRKFRDDTPENLGGDYKRDYKMDNNTPLPPKGGIPPTRVEVAAYAKSRGWADPDGFAAHFIDYYTEAKWRLSNGKPMKDWKKAVITWEPNNKARTFATAATKKLRKMSKEEFDTMMMR